MAQHRKQQLAAQLTEYLNRTVVPQYMQIVADPHIDNVFAVQVCFPWRTPLSEGNPHQFLVNVAVGAESVEEVAFGTWRPAVNRFHR